MSKPEPLVSDGEMHLTFAHLASADCGRPANSEEPKACHTRTYLKGCRPRSVIIA
jgi:hypothetical protein